ncbi:MAG: hypothetical protein AAGG11_21065, partial [Pseudomonadota bacterium]
MATARQAAGESALYIGRRRIPPGKETSYDRDPPLYTGQLADCAGRVVDVELHKRRFESIGMATPVLWEPESRCITPLSPVFKGATAEQFALWTVDLEAEQDSGCNEGQRFSAFGSGGNAEVGPTGLVVTVTERDGRDHYDIAIVRQQPGAKFDAGSARSIGAGLFEAGGAVASDSAGLFRESWRRNQKKLERYPPFMIGTLTDARGWEHPVSFRRILFRGEKYPSVTMYDHYSGCMYAFGRFSPGADQRESVYLSSTGTGLNVECNERLQLRTEITVRTEDGNRTSIPGVNGVRLSRAGENRYAVSVSGVLGSFGEPLAEGIVEKTNDKPLYVDRTPTGGLKAPTGYFVVNNFGLFRLRSGASFNTFDLVVEQGTDVLSLFPPGDVWARAYWNAEQQFLAVTAIRRVVDGICPDQDAPTQTYRFAALPTAGNQVLREGAGAQRDPETCVSAVLDASTCKVLRCEQRAGNLSYADEQWVLAASEALARALYDVVPKWTLASMGMGDPTKI